MGLGGLIIASDDAREHAGIGRFRLPPDQGEADARLRSHGETAEHFDMGMPGPQKHNVRLDRAAWLHERVLSLSYRGFEPSGRGRGDPCQRFPRGPEPRVSRRCRD